MNRESSLGSTSNNFNVSFTEPWLFDIPLWCKLDFWKYKTEYDYYDLDTRGAGITFGYPIWEKIVGYLGYKYYVDDISDVLSSATESIKRQEGTTAISAATVSFSRDTTDDYIFPSKGTKSSIAVTYAGGPLQGDAEYVQYNGSLFAYFPLPLGVVFSAKGRIGYIDGKMKKFPCPQDMFWEASTLCGVSVMSVRRAEEQATS